MPNPSTLHTSTHGHGQAPLPPLPTSASAGPPPPPPSTSSAAPAPRGRAQGTRKRATAADDAAYHAAAGTKRVAAERAEGDRERAKRKRVEAASAAAGAGGGAGTGDREERASLVDFTTLPADALHRYLAHYDLIPELEPSPMAVEDPGPLSSLLRGKSHLVPYGHTLRRMSTASPGPGSAGGGNRARGGRRRSSRLVEEERQPALPPVYGDLAEVGGVLAEIAGRHFRESEVKEVDTLAAFMFAVKAKSVLKDI